MKQVGSTLFLNEADVNAAQIFTKNKKYQLFFLMKEGETQFSDKFDDYDSCINIALSLGLDQIQEGLFVNKKQVHTARVFDKKSQKQLAIEGQEGSEIKVENFKVCLTFKTGKPVFTSEFPDFASAANFILDNF